MPVEIISKLVAATSSLNAAVATEVVAMGGGDMASQFMSSIDRACGTLRRSLEDDRLTSWWDMTGVNPKITVARVDIRGTLPNVPLAFLSATLFPKGLIEYHPNQFGLTNYDSIMLQSPFDLPKQVIGYASPRDEEPTEVPLSELAGLIQASRGRALVLFTNRQNMLNTAEHLKEVLPYPVYVQGEETVDIIAKKFRTDVNSVLCATRSFFEGVNFPGETCSLVVMVSLPFTHPEDPLHSARQRYLENRNVRAFSNLTLPEMLTTFEQAVGRAIRTVDDRAAIAVLDPRLASPSRRKQYGHDVARTLKGIRWTYDVKDVESFFTPA
jgi:ATP-dependent DNA helicase DinG